MTALVEVEGLVKTFGTGETATRVLRGLSLTLQAGEMTALLGPSGSGKSTLLTILGTLMQPSSGSHRMLGVDLVAADDRALTAFRNLHIGFVFQFHNLLPDFTALENVIFPTAVRAGRETAAARARGRELLVRMGLAARIDFPSANLSGGQKQRVAVARALAVEPQVMLLDEPLSALDLKLRQNMRAELRAIQKRTGVTFIFITHDQGEALAMSDRVGVMSQGRLQQVADPRDIYNNPVNGFVASFVGENNVFTGTIGAAADGFASFASPQGTFRARLGAGAKSGASKLYVRPEHTMLSATPGAENAVAVTVGDVSFEGAFIAVSGTSDQGARLTAEIRNDGSATVPAAGSRLYMTFDAARAAILPDHDRAGSGPQAGA